MENSGLKADSRASLKGHYALQAFDGLQGLQRLTKQKLQSGQIPNLEELHNSISVIDAELNSLRQMYKSIISRRSCL
jgi:hypothetical protein